MLLSVGFWTYQLATFDCSSCRIWVSYCSCTVSTYFNCSASWEVILISVFHILLNFSLFIFSYVAGICYWYLGSWNIWFVLLSVGLHTIKSRPCLIFVISKLFYLRLICIGTCIFVNQSFSCFSCIVISCLFIWTCVFIAIRCLCCIFLVISKTAIIILSDTITKLFHSIV